MWIIYLNMLTSYSNTFKVMSNEDIDALNNAPQSPINEPLDSEENDESINNDEDE